MLQKDAADSEIEHVHFKMCRLIWLPHNQNRLLRKEVFEGMESSFLGCILVSSDVPLSEVIQIMGQASKISNELMVEVSNA